MVETVRLRPALVRLPGGSFLMGSPEEAEVGGGERQADEDEVPQRLIEIPAFSLCQTEVTQGQYEAVMGERPSTCDFGCGDELPVHNVSWRGAVDYLNKLTALESEALAALGEAPLTACYGVNGEEMTWTAGCTGYRLPTEAEWEYAARAGTTTSWSFGEDPDVAGEYAWYFGNARGTVHTVGGKNANPWGLYDLHGNVREWVWDAYDSYKSDKVVNSEGDHRALRGGAFYNTPRFLRAAYRFRVMSVDQDRNAGFRCARGPGPQR